MVAEAVALLNRIPAGAPVPVEDVPLLEQLLAVARSGIVALDDPGKYSNPWSGLVPKRQAAIAGEPTAHDPLARPQYFLSGDGQLAFLLVRPVGEKDDFTGSQKSVGLLRSLVDEVRPAFADLQLGVTGLPVLETDEMLASQRDSARASWFALAGVAVLYLIVFRGLRAPLLTVTTLIVGTVWALGWLTLTVGHLNLLSATFAVMLIGMGDYGVLWVTRYQQERSAGLGVRDALQATARGVGPGILTASLTTALAFFATMLADFQAVAELGWVAGCGVMLCAFACFTVLPALIVLFDGRRELAGDASRLTLPTPYEAPARAPVWLPGLSRRPIRVLLAGAALFLLLGVGALRTQYDHNLLELQADTLDSVRWERTLISHTAGASWHALSYTASRERALDLKARFEALPTVSRVVEVASLVPAEQEAKLPRLRDIHARLDKLPPRESLIAPLPSSPTALSHDIRTLARKSQGFEGELIPDLVRALTALSSQLAQMSEEQARARLNLFEKRVLSDLSEDLHRLRDVSHPEPIERTDLPASLRERYVSPQGKWLLRVFGSESLWEYEPLAQFVASVQTVDAGATGKPFTTLEGLRAMKLGFQWAGLYALLAIVAVLLLDFRAVGPVLLALGPLLAAVVMTLGVLGLFGITLNPANIIALPLIVGVGVDNGVHVLHDYLDRKRSGPYLLRRSTGTGILVAGLTTILGFGALMLSSHRGLHGLGLILALGVGFSLLASLIVLPAGLHLWSRRNAVAAQDRQARHAA